MTGLLQTIWKKASQILQNDDSVKKAKDQNESREQGGGNNVNDPDYSLKTSDYERESLNIVCDWMKAHQQDKIKYGCGSSLDVNNLERCAKQRRVQSMYIDSEIESKLDEIITFVEKILPIIFDKPSKVPVWKHDEWYNRIHDLEWQSFRCRYTADYCSKKQEKVSDSEHGSIKKCLASCQGFFETLPERVKNVCQSIPRKPCAQYIVDARGREFVRKAVEDIMSNDKTLLSKCAPLNYSPGVWTEDERVQVYTLDNIDPKCELAFILREVKAGLERNHFYVEGLYCSREDGWYSCIYATVEHDNKRAVRLKNEVSSDVLDAEAKEKVRQERLQTSIENLKDDIDFFSSDHSSDHFYHAKLKSRLRSFKNTYEGVKAELDGDMLRRANQMSKKLQNVVA